MKYSWWYVQYMVDHKPHARMISAMYKHVAQDMVEVAIPKARVFKVTNIPEKDLHLYLGEEY